MAKKDTPERKDIPQQYRWKTTHLYSSDKAWQADRKRLLESFEVIALCKGKLKRSKKMTLTCLERVFEGHKLLARLQNYAHRKYDQDTRVSQYQGLKAVIDKTATDFYETIAFVQPELLSLPESRLQALIEDPKFSDYAQYLREILRLKPHILTGPEENLLAATGQMRDAPYTVYSAFSAADLTFPTIEDEKGKEVPLSQALFAKYRSSPDRAVRKRAFDAFFGTYAGYKNTLATLLSSQINGNITFAKARKWDSALEAALGANAVPTAVYHNMIKAVNRYLPLLHRYLALRQKLLGLDQLHYYDMYPSVVKKVKMSFDYEQGNALILESLKPMGQEYVDALAAGLDPKSGWVDPFPNAGKRSGAYMDGSAYEVHPFVLSNFIGDYSSVSTMAHEMGHAMHSYFSNRTQPFAKSDYSIFVAEVASTFNEALLMRHMLAQESKPARRLYLLGEQLESFRQTLFRQSMFAEFELALYQRAEAQEALTAEAISAIYLDIVRRYYGHKEGVVQVEPAYAIEWAYVPHFYYNFYVFQYVTGIVAATALAEKIASGAPGAREAYMEHLLKAGGSDYAIDLLKQAGVDLTKLEPYDLALGVFERSLNEAEALVAQMAEKKNKKSKKGKKGKNQKDKTRKGKK